MNYKFRILWFEDESGWYRGAKTKADLHIARHCLESDITRKRNADFDIELLKGNAFDLILMDYDLNSTRTGDSLIQEIREAEVFTDILFYSSKYDSLLGSIQTVTPPIDGVFYANRKIEEFNSKLEKIIDKIVCRSENLINLRGFVLDSTSDFEVRIKEILKICWDKFNKDQRSSIEETLQKLFVDKTNRTETSVAHFNKQECVFLSANDDEYFLSVSDRLDLLNVVLDILVKEYSLPAEHAHGNFKEYYIGGVNIYRNRLGHVKFGDDKIRIKGKDIPIDQELHRFLRTNIIDCEKALGNIETYITQVI